jgi:alkanesulfonate monooxygenase SsuD/methylene tetrahydromethanopterin reductase-like flavin-dependent oxidoreductase (luciferase family)
MRYGFVLPFGDAKVAADLAVEAEEAGWDGFFAWEGVWAVDAWVTLAAAATRTSRIRLGTMLTPLPRRYPWDVASQSATLDNLSDGRVILSVGLGAADERWWLFEDDPGRRVRAERLDEGLAMLTLMWRGEPFSFAGTHYRAREATRMLPAPTVQRPRIPVWVVGLWPSDRSMRRVARWDGWLPYFPVADGDLNRPDRDQLRSGVAWLREERARQGLSMDGYDVVMEGNTKPGPDAVAEAASWAQAGATWWLEADWSLEGDGVAEACRERLRAGPPRPAVR